MLLTKEINNIKRISAEHDREYPFPSINQNADSYYICYSDSAHQNMVLNEYSSEFLPFKKKLVSLWSGSNMQCFSADILTSIMKAKDDEESVIEAIQLYNYMM